MNPPDLAGRKPTVVPLMGRPGRVRHDNPDATPERFVGHEMSRGVVRLVPARDVGHSSFEGSDDDEREVFPSEPDAVPEESTGMDDNGDGASAPTTRTPLPGLDDDTLGRLIQRVAGRDERALEDLYDATSARVHGLVLRITQQGALAEEVVEETYWQVWRQALRFDPLRGRPLTWLLAMARSRAIDALRRDRRYAHDELPDDDAAAEALAAPPAQDLVDASRSDERLHRAVAALDARSRQLIALAFFRGLTHEEIARQESVPLGTVKSVIRRAMQQLRSRMEQPLQESPP